MTFHARGASGLRLDYPDLGAFMPLFAHIARDGTIVAAGATLAKLCGRPLAGVPLSSVLGPGRAAAAGDSWGALDAVAGRRLQVHLIDRPATSLRGMLVPLADGQGFLLNLSFGAGAWQAVRAHGLSIADFAHTDLTVELLYLAEARDAVTHELATLNARLRDAREAAELRADTDALTGLVNRRGFDEALASAVSAAGRGQPFVLAQIDLDHFKAVNDGFGHAAGDAVLAGVAEVLRSETRKHDTLARLGGDEFAIILHGEGNPDAAVAMSERIIAGIERRHLFGEPEFRVSASIGLTCSLFYETLVPAGLLADADAALYAAKHAGRGRAVVHDPAAARDAREGIAPAAGPCRGPG